MIIVTFAAFLVSYPLPCVQEKKANVKRKHSNSDTIKIVSY